MAKLAPQGSVSGQNGSFFVVIMKTAIDPFSSRTGIEEWRPTLELAVREVFEMMLGYRIGPETPRHDERFEMTSMVGLAGEICGVLKLYCSKVSGRIMASKMLGLPAAEVGAELPDALGEIGNMIAGNFKK